MRNITHGALARKEREAQENIRELGGLRRALDSTDDPELRTAIGLTIKAMLPEAETALERLQESIIAETGRLLGRRPPRDSIAKGTFDRSLLAMLTARRPTARRAPRRRARRAHRAAVRAVVASSAGDGPPAPPHAPPRALGQQVEGSSRIDRIAALLVGALDGAR